MALRIMINISTKVLYFFKGIDVNYEVLLFFSLLLMIKSYCSSYLLLILYNIGNDRILI